MTETELLKQIAAKRHKMIQKADEVHAKKFFKEGPSIAVYVSIITILIVIIIASVYLGYLISDTNRVPTRVANSVTSNVPMITQNIVNNYPSNKTEFIIKGTKAATCLSTPDSNIMTCYKENE